MKKRHLHILICGMMLAILLPTTTIGIATCIQSTTETCGLLDRTTMRGFALYLGRDATGRTMHLFALRVHYLTIDLSGQRDSGVIRMRPIDIPNKIIGYHGHIYISASFRGAINI